jgi:hypothetical protein
MIFVSAKSTKLAVVFCLLLNIACIVCTVYTLIKYKCHLFSLSPLTITYTVYLEGTFLLISHTLNLTEVWFFANFCSPKTFNFEYAVFRTLFETYLIFL